MHILYGPEVHLLFQTIFLSPFAFCKTLEIALLFLGKEFLVDQRRDSVLVILPPEDLLELFIALFYLFGQYDRTGETLEGEGMVLLDALHKGLLEFFLEVVTLFLLESGSIPGHLGEIGASEGAPKSSTAGGLSHRLTILGHEGVLQESLELEQVDLGRAG